MPPAFPDLPKNPPPDPNEGRAFPETVRKAKRTVIIVCGLSIAWSAAQFALENNKVGIFGTSVHISSAAIPIILSSILIYTTIQWIIEFAMMPRHIRSWPMGKLDFKITFAIARLSILVISAGTLNQTISTVAMALILILAMAAASTTLSTILMFIAMPIRLRARSKAKRTSVAYAAYEALVWAGFLAIPITIAGVIAVVIASYKYTALQQLIWETPPNVISIAIFLIVLIAAFLSHWMLRPMMSKLFAEPSSYYTERHESGRKMIFFRQTERESLL